MINTQSKNSNTSVWFEGSNQINIRIKEICDSFKDVGSTYTSITKLMPGITMAEMVEQGAEFVTIKTNEGIMKRKNISKTIQDNMVVVEFDEEYQVGKLITTKSHHLEKYNSNGSKITHHLVISNVKAYGFLGFFYRFFGKMNIGNAILKSHKDYFENK